MKIGCHSHFEAINAKFFFPTNITETFPKKSIIFNKNGNKVIQGSLPNYITLCLQAVGIDS